MTIGAVDTTLYTGNITYTASSASDYWEIPLDGVSLNGNSLGISSTDTLIDSGKRKFSNRLQILHNLLIFAFYRQELHLFTSLKLKLHYSILVSVEVMKQVEVFGDILALLYQF